MNDNSSATGDAMYRPILIAAVPAVYAAIGAFAAAHSPGYNAVAGAVVGGLLGFVVVIVAIAGEKR